MKKDQVAICTCQTGDLNLAAALMACGVPLSQQDPIAIIQPEHGKRYGSFRLGPATIDGEDETRDLMDAWTGKLPLPPAHPFQTISDFLKSRPENCRSTPDMFDYAIAYLRMESLAVSGVARITDIPAFVERNRKSTAAFILAFVHCREMLFQQFTRARTDHYLQRGSGQEIRRAMISSNLPKWQRAELTSRLNG